LFAGLLCAAVAAADTAGVNTARCYEIIKADAQHWVPSHSQWWLYTYDRSNELVINVIIQKTYQFINVVNGVSHSHKIANIFYSF